MFFVYTLPLARPAQAKIQILTTSIFIVTILLSKILRTLPAIDCLDLMPWIPVWSWSWVGMSKNMFPVQWMYWWSVENMAEEDCFWLLSVALLINPNLWTEYIIEFQGMIVSVIILSDQKFSFKNSNLLKISRTHTSIFRQQLKIEIVSSLFKLQSFQLLWSP